MTTPSALQSLTQDLTAFNLEHYRQLQGELTLADLKTSMEASILRLGGSFVPDGDSCCIETPQALLEHQNVATRYDTTCFRRDVAMRFMDIGHPLVDATVAYFQRPSWSGDVAILTSADEASGLSVRVVLEAMLDDGSSRQRYESADTTADGAWAVRSLKKDVDVLREENDQVPARLMSAEYVAPRDRVASAMADAEAQLRCELSTV